ncbi:MAG: penicillin acylase family protein [Acidobacteria bacterium]|nr:penicillin acylase family protein [Acidobacteriota bacterium]MCB9398933.1 penicillin acylase family protein [Acidobacteriota bacterium]
MRFGGWTWLRRLGRIFLALIALALIVSVVALIWLRRSLPLLDGTVISPDLTQNVKVDRDSMGVPSIYAATWPDLAFAQGFVHAQDRFFQMDLMRRQSVGRLSELIGKRALDYDQRQRIHQLDTVAQKAFERETPQHRAIAEAYAAGVNAGLKSLKSRPFEYILLSATPEPWQPKDSFCVILAMFFELHDSQANQDRNLGLLREALGDEWCEYLAPRGTLWDSPVVGEPFSQPGIPQNSLPLAPTPEGDPAPEPEKPGSNNWAVGGGLTETGAAMLANDMHLGIRNPNTWYRVDLHLTEGPKATRCTGVSLPGVPGMVSGSNGSIAWGFTNSYGDYYDLIELEENPARTHYRTNEGWMEYGHINDPIRVKGEPDAVLSLKTTQWGPVLEYGPHHYALLWTAHFPEAINFNLVRMMEARSVAEAVAVAPQCGIPPQNLMVVDAQGNLAWTIIGRIPNRTFDGRFPVPWSQAGLGWQGWLGPDLVPKVVNPTDQRLWTANSRVCSGEDVQRLGDGGYDLAARARQIRDRLYARDRFKESDFLDIQLDFEARFMGEWQKFLLTTLQSAEHRTPLQEKCLGILQQWEGVASTDSKAYFLVRNLRRSLSRAVMATFTQSLKENKNFDFGQLPQTEGPVWDLLTKQPSHLVPANSESWSAWILNEIESQLQKLEKEEGPVEELTWGRFNVFQAQHPLASGIPFLGRYLNSEPRALPGDSNLPRVQATRFGASERLVVQPGHEEKAFFHMPGGQCGHPLSPFFLKGIHDWESGKATPLLPGPAKYHLTLQARSPK